MIDVHAPILDSDSKLNSIHLKGGGCKNESEVTCNLYLGCTTFWPKDTMIFLNGCHGCSTSTYGTFASV
jgi:hypothetical protein